MIGSSIRSEEPFDTYLPVSLNKPSYEPETDTEDNVVLRVIPESSISAVMITFVTVSTTPAVSSNTILFVKVPNSVLRITSDNSVFSRSIEIIS